MMACVNAYPSHEWRCVCGETNPSLCYVVAWSRCADCETWTANRSGMCGRHETQLDRDLSHPLCQEKGCGQKADGRSGMCMKHIAKQARRLERRLEHLEQS